MTFGGEIQAEAGSNRPSQIRCSKLTSLFLCASMLAMASRALAGEEKAPYMETASHGPLLAYASVVPYPAPAQTSLWSAHSRDLGASEAPVHLAYDRVQAIFYTAAVSSSSTDDALVVVRCKVPSRFAYHAWAKLETGYGQYLGPDTIGRWRTNGAGVEDP